MRKSLVGVLLAVLLSGSAVLVLPALSQGRSSPKPTARPAAVRRACLGYKLRTWLNNDGMTATYRYSPVFRGGWPPRPWTSASVWYNGTHSVWYYDQPGRHVDAFPWRGWRVTKLVLKVSSGELALGGKVYRCRNHRYR